MLRQPAGFLKNTCNAFIEQNKPLNKYDFFSKKFNDTLNSFGYYFFFADSAHV